MALVKPSWHAVLGLARGSISRAFVSSVDRMPRHPILRSPHLPPGRRQAFCETAFAILVSPIGRFLPEGRRVPRQAGRFTLEARGAKEFDVMRTSADWAVFVR